MRRLRVAGDVGSGSLRTDSPSSLIGQSLPRPDPSAQVLAATRAHAWRNRSTPRLAGFSSDRVESTESSGDIYPSAFLEFREDRNSEIRELTAISLASSAPVRHGKVIAHSRHRTNRIPRTNTRMEGTIMRSQFATGAALLTAVLFAVPLSAS